MSIKAMKNDFLKARSLLLVLRGKFKIQMDKNLANVKSIHDVSCRCILDFRMPFLYETKLQNMAQIPFETNEGYVFTAKIDMP